MIRDFSNFKLVFKPKVVHNKRNSRAPNPDVIRNDQKLTKLVIGTCILKDNSFEVVVKYDDYKDRLSKDVKLEEVGDSELTLRFTRQSYNCKDVNIIFTRNGQLDNKYYCVHRTESDRIFKRVDEHRYVPFCHNWIVRGWIVRIGNRLYFHFRKCITIKGHNYNVKHWIDDDKFLLNGKWYY